MSKKDEQIAIDSNTVNTGELPTQGAVTGQTVTHSPEVEELLKEKHVVIKAKSEDEIFKKFDEIQSELANYRIATGAVCYDRDNFIYLMHIYLL